jgi:crotonobetainyl-CoA:carnitine CoA-transferase CaiB-like acyl-CoA transferase
MTPGPFSRALRSVSEALAGPGFALEGVELAGPPTGLPSSYAVGEAAAALVAAATLAVAEVHGARTKTGGPTRRVLLEGGHVAAAFRSERYLRAVGWPLPPLWDPVAGDYEAKDGEWIRLHTNYAWHRGAALRVLGVAPERTEVARAVSAWDAETLEAAIVAEGGCAARMRTGAEWAVHPQGRAVAAEPLVSYDPVAVSGPLRFSGLHESDAPLAGVRVVDLTRVIAGPVCTRFLAAHGADVVRVDPPGFEEPAGLLADSMAGKRQVALDLRDRAGRHTFEQLVASAHVLVCGYRSDALERLGYSHTTLRTGSPGLVIAQLDAYGWTGPWRARRGFDSLVQMSCGIAARGAEVVGSRRPNPLPAQALDHGTGYLLAAAICRALAGQFAGGAVATVRSSLARTAKWLVDLGEGGDPAAHDLTPDEAAVWMEPAETPWGKVERVRCPGRLQGLSCPSWPLPRP